MLKVLIVEGQAGDKNRLNKLLHFLSTNKINVLDHDVEPALFFQVVEEFTPDLIFIFRINSLILGVDSTSVPEIHVRKGKFYTYFPNKLSPELSDSELDFFREYVLNQLTKPKKQKKLAISTLNEIQFIDYKQIMFCKADGYSSKIYCQNGKKYCISKNLKQVCILIQSKAFVRVHKSYLINIHFVDSYLKNDGGSLKLKDETIIPVSRIYKEQLLKKLNVNSIMSSLGQNVIL